MARKRVPVGFDPFADLTPAVVVEGSPFTAFPADAVGRIAEIVAEKAGAGAVTYNVGVTLPLSGDGDHDLRDILQAFADMRHALGWSQAKVGDRMGTTQSAVSELERGTVEPGIRTFFRYLAAVGLDVRIFVSRPPEPEPPAHNPPLEITGNTDALTAGDRATIEAVLGSFGLGLKLGEQQIPDSPEA